MSSSRHTEGLKCRLYFMTAGNVAHVGARFGVDGLGPFLVAAELGAWQWKVLAFYSVVRPSITTDFLPPSERFSLQCYTQKGSINTLCQDCFFRA